MNMAGVTDEARGGLRSEDGGVGDSMVGITTGLAGAFQGKPLGES